MESNNSEDFGPEWQNNALVINNEDCFINIVSGLGITSIFLILVIITMCIKLFLRGQKTRNPQQRRMYVGSRARPSLGTHALTHEPTIFVSPSNLPPPPKYECMAPPSYEEVVGIHYPNYQVQQPIAQPIATALAQQSSPSTANDTGTEAQRTDDQRTDTQRTDASSNERSTQDTVVTVNERTTVTSS